MQQIWQNHMRTTIRNDIYTKELNISKFSDDTMKDNISNSQFNAQRKDDWDNSRSNSWDEMIIEEEKQKLTTKIMKNSKATHNIEF